MRTKRMSKKLSLENLEQRQLLTVAAGITQVDPPNQEFYHILPYLEQDNLYKAVEQDEENTSSLLLPAVQKIRAGGGIEVTDSEADSSPSATAVDEMLTDGDGQVSHIRNWAVNGSKLA